MFFCCCTTDLDGSEIPGLEAVEAAQRTSFNRRGMSNATDNAKDTAKLGLACWIRRTWKCRSHQAEQWLSEQVPQNCIVYHQKKGRHGSLKKGNRTAHSTPLSPGPRSQGSPSASKPGRCLMRRWLRFGQQNRIALDEKSPFSAIFRMAFCLAPLHSVANSNESRWHIWWPFVLDKLLLVIRWRLLQSGGSLLTSRKKYRSCRWAAHGDFLVADCSCSLLNCPCWIEGFWFVGADLTHVTISAKRHCAHRNRTNFLHLGQKTLH